MCKTGIMPAQTTLGSSYEVLKSSRTKVLCEVRVPYILGAKTYNQWTERETIRKPPNLLPSEANPS